MRLYVNEDIGTADGGFTSVMSKNRNVDYTAPCSNPNCTEIGTRSQYGYDEICRKCGSPFDWSRQKRWSHGKL